MATSWYLENSNSSINQHIPLTGTLSKVLNTIKNTDTLLVNGMFSSDLPAVNEAIKYFTNLDHGDIIGGRHQMDNPNRYSGKQVKSNGNHNRGVRHLVKSRTPLDLLGINFEIRNQM